MKFVINHITDAQWNMAHDEFLLEGLEDTVFCLWQNAPSVIIGLNQSVQAEVNLPYLKENGIMLARRVTGGGAVYHDLQNLNYTFAGPTEIIDRHYDTMSDALRRLGAPARRSGRNDILVDGRKCSGYAKRLSKNRTIIHGTLMWDVDLEPLGKALAVPGSKLQASGIASVPSRVANLKDFLPQFGDIHAFRSALHQMLAGTDGELVLTAQQKARIDRMADEKFRSWDWIYGHSPSASFQSSKKYPCGTIEVRYTLKHGLFTEVRFGGDFIGNRAVSELEDTLRGRRPEEVQETPVGEYFDGLSSADLMELFR